MSIQEENKIKNATKEDWKYIEELVIKYKIDLSKIEGPRKKKLLDIISTNKELLNEYIECGKNLNLQYYRGNTLLMVASAKGNNPVVERLLEKGANVDVCDNCGNSALHIACAQGYKDVVDLLFEKGANVKTFNKNENSPLHEACFNGHEAVVELLLKKEVSIINDRNKWGDSAINVACFNGHTKVVELLLKKKADISICDNEGDNSLHKACNQGNKEIVKLLIENGADINARDKSGDTALHKACFNGHEDIVKLLIRNGADINIKNNFGSSVLTIAKNRGHKNLVTLLKKIKNGTNIKLKINLENKRKQNEQLKHELLDACEKKNEIRAIKIIKNVDELTDEHLLKSINAFDEKTLRALAEKVGYTKMGNMLNKIEDNDKCNKIVNEIYKKIILTDVSGKARDLLQKKINQEIHNLCKTGTKIKDLKDLLDITEIQDEFLINIINISADNALNILIKKVGPNRINRIFKNIDTCKYDSIVNKLYKVKDILNIATEELRELLYKKIKDEVIEAHKSNKKQYKDILLNTGIQIDLTEFGVTFPKNTYKNMFIEVTNNDITLIDAILSNNKNKMRTLKHHEDKINSVDNKGKNALMHAIEKGCIDFAYDLIENGADVNAKDNNNKSVIMYALEKNAVDMVEVLLEMGVDTKEKDNNDKSVLMYALEKGKSMSYAIDLMIKNTNYYNEDKRGVNVLMYACQGGYMPAVKALVETIPSNILNKVLDYSRRPGDTALRRAVEENHEEVAKYLLRKGVANFSEIKGGKLDNLMKWQQDINREKKINSLMGKISSKKRGKQKNL